MSIAKGKKDRIDGGGQLTVSAMLVSLSVSAFHGTRDYISVSFTVISPEIGIKA